MRATDYKGQASVTVTPHALQEEVIFSIKMLIAIGRRRNLYPLATLRLGLYACFLLSLRAAKWMGFRSVKNWLCGRGLKSLQERLFTEPLALGLVFAARRKKKTGFTRGCSHIWIYLLLQRLCCAFRAHCFVSVMLTWPKPSSLRLCHCNINAANEQNCSELSIGRVTVTERARCARKAQRSRCTSTGWIEM